ncbi:WD40 repeat-like protein [Sistotremastrum suecicum HHB10207 ss-3]|uniref:WD40 repeat-like protein n=1 Tax=Sistotremastrum suecicum HHB10207 ss-3 TaxID=1314776 RepID=A0A166JBG6_9AGAM|nr:WD40 repeat-like protein [Sistotremastrum suecicum HHB10207 ss-3]
MSASPEGTEHSDITPPPEEPAPVPQSTSRSDSDAAANDIISNRGFNQDSNSPDKSDTELRRTTRSTTRAQANHVQSQDVIKAAAPFATKNTAADTSTVQALQAIPSTAQKLSTLLTSVAGQGAEDILSLDPSDRLEGFKDLESWVDGSLDMYRPEFRPILFPIFCHFYLDLVQLGLQESATKFFKTFSPSLKAVHNPTLYHLGTLLLPAHVQTDLLAQRFRNEKYVLRMSRSGFSLLIGWLTEGVGGESVGAGDGFTGERGKRGRASVMQVVNNHLRFDVTTSNVTMVPTSTWEESTGLISSLIPNDDSGQSHQESKSFNAAQGPLKLGPAPLDEGLQQETERVLREEAMSDPMANATLSADLQYVRPTPAPGLVEPTAADLLPAPPTFKTVDVRREVERVRDTRKRIRLDPSLHQERDLLGFGPQANMARARSLPSIVAYTLHDTGDTASCLSFSQDSTLLATGLTESYIRLWNLKGEKLKGYRSDFQESAVKDSAGLRKLKERGGSTTRKLIGHSGPVYSVAFDPIGGTASAPRHLLSASADHTVRLWSLDTMTNVVAYRGHQDPVWDVQWSPMGIYFATASRDRTARLWSTDRIYALRMYAGHLSDVEAVRFHPNSLYLATASSDWTCRLWDTQKGSCVRVFVGHQGVVSTLAFSPDGKYLASAGDDLAINLWDLGSGKRIKKMTGHTSTIHSLAFSAESSLLVSGGADWTVRCWDVKSPGGKGSKNGLQNDGRVNGALPIGNENDNDNNETSDLVTTYPTKRTPIINVQFTARNLCMVGGPYIS